MKYIIILSLFLFGFTPAPKVKGPPDILTEIQMKALNVMSLKEQAYMDGCLNDRNPYHDSSFNLCLRVMNEAIGCIQQQPQQENHTIIKSAAGAAIGYGVGKMLFGGKRK